MICCSRFCAPPTLPTMALPSGFEPATVCEAPSCVSSGATAAESAGSTGTGALELGGRGGRHCGGRACSTGRAHLVTRGGSRLILLFAGNRGEQHERYRQAESLVRHE